jgi:hypothetical protein
MKKKQAIKKPKITKMQCNGQNGCRVVVILPYGIAKAA